MRGTVVNTPGYYYAISYWLSALVMILVHGCGKKDVWKYVYGVLSFISIFTVMFFTDGIKQMFFMPLMVCVFLLMLLYIRMAGELPWRETGFFCAKAFINAEFAASLCWQIHYFYTGDFSGQEKGTPEQMLWRVLHMVVIYAVLYILIYLIERYLKKDIEELQITRRELLVVYFVLIMVYCISNVSYVDVKSIFSAGTAMDVFIIRTLADLSAFSDDAWAVDGSGRCDHGIFCDPDIFAAFFVFCRIECFAEFKNKIFNERKHFPWIRFAFKDFCGNGLG